MPHFGWTRECLAMTQEEIARIEGISVSRVAQIQNNALRKLRKFGFLEEHLQAIADLSRKRSPYEENA